MIGFSFRAWASCISLFLHADAHICSSTYEAVTVSSGGVPKAKEWIASAGLSYGSPFHGETPPFEFWGPGSCLDGCLLAVDGLQSCRGLVNVGEFFRKKKLMWVIGP